MPVRLRRILPVLALLGLIATLDSSTACAQEVDDSPLVTRAKALMRGLDQLETEQHRIDRRTALRSMADSLEAAGELVMATHALERASMMSYQLGDYAEMELDSERGLELARQSGDRKREASLLNVQAIAVSITGDNTRASRMQEELILLRQELGDRRGEGGSWHNLAYSRLALFETPEAVEALRQALRCHQEVGNAYGIATSMASLSNALFDLGRLEEGLAMADSAVSAAELQGAPILIGSNLNSRGHKRNWLGYGESALEDFDRAWEVLTTSGIRNVAATGAINRAEALIGLGRCEEALASLDAVSDDLEELGSQAARLYARAVRGRALLDCRDAEAAQGTLRTALEEMQSFRDALEEEGSRAESFRVAGSAFADLAWAELQQDHTAEAWHILESGSSAMLREDLSPQDDVVTLEDFQAYLQKVQGTALHFSAASADRVLAFWITPDDARGIMVTMAPGFRTSLSTTMRLLASNASDEDLAPALQRVAATLLQALPADLGGATRLVVIPGAFTGFPFETLPLPIGEELGGRMAMAYTPSATILMELETRTASSGPLIAFADPAPGELSAARPEFPTRAAQLAGVPLPEARQEAMSIAQGGGEVLVGEDATPSALAEAAPRAAVLHLATHSLIDAFSPGGSALLLAGSDEGLVSAETITAMSLHCDLASLSGCSTAGGYVVAGEGTLGLTRSFLQAGARSVVATRWDVEDASARRFMESFYAALREGQDRDRAMQSARRTLAENGAGHRERSAFMLVGVAAEPVTALQAPGTRTGTRGLIWFAGIFTVLLMLVVLRRR